MYTKPLFITLLVLTIFSTSYAQDRRISILVDLTGIYQYDLFGEFSDIETDHLSYFAPSVGLRLGKTNRHFYNDFYLCPGYSTDNTTKETINGIQYTYGYSANVMWAQHSLGFKMRKNKNFSPILCLDNYITSFMYEFDPVADDNLKSISKTGFQTMLGGGVVFPVGAVLSVHFLIDMGLMDLTVQSFTDEDPSLEYAEHEKTDDSFTFLPMNVNLRMGVQFKLKRD